MPWTFLDNYAPFLNEEDADTITEMLYKCKEVILALFTSICEKGEEEGVLFEISDSAINFAYNGIIGSLSEEVDAEYDLEDEDSKAFIEELATNVVKQLN